MMRPVRDWCLIGALTLGLASCGGQNKLGDGVIDIDGDGQGLKVNAVTLSVAGLTTAQAVGNLYVGRPNCAEGQDFLHDQCSKPEIVSKVNMALPAITQAIDLLRPLVDSTDRAAIDAALAIAKKARTTLEDALAAQ